MEDAKIIELFWERNEQAVKETDTAYGRKLYVLSNNILNNREDAEEPVYILCTGHRYRIPDCDDTVCRITWQAGRVQTDP